MKNRFDRFPDKGDRLSYLKIGLHFVCCQIIFTEHNDIDISKSSMIKKIPELQEYIAKRHWMQVILEED